MTTENDYDDTPETAPVLPRSQKSITAAQAREDRDGPIFKALRKKFRDNCSRHRNVDGSIGTPCHLCGQDIDYRLEAGHPQAFELDHIVTVKERPDLLLDVANFGPSHRDCNQRRGTDELPLHLGEPSELW